MEKIKKILRAFNNAKDDIESLSDYYYRSNKTLKAYQIDIDNKYASGKKIADLMDSLFLIGSARKRNEKIKEINEIIIEKDLRFCDICEIVPFQEDNSNSIAFSFKSEESIKYDPKTAKEKYNHIEKYAYIFFESILSHIIVSFETFLSSIYRILLMADPKKYFEGQTILLASIFNEKINDIINEKIDTEISAKMRDSLIGLKTIAEKEKISLQPHKDLAEAFKELYYRRNAYVHTKGKINKDYLQKVNKAISKNKKIGDKLVCDDVYFDNAICILNQIIFTITFELLKKEKATENAIAVLAYYYFEKLSMGEYRLSKYVYYMLSQYTTLQFSDRLMYRINYINAAKQLGETELVQNELKELDVSATEDQFKIAKECLEDHFDVVFTMLNKTYPNSFQAIAIKEWPIFIGFRKTDYYKKFIELHKDDFAIQHINDGQGEIDDLMDKENHSDE